MKKTKIQKVEKTESLNNEENDDQNEKIEKKSAEELLKEINEKLILIVETQKNIQLSIDLQLKANNEVIQELIKNNISKEHHESSLNWEKENPEKAIQKNELLNKKNEQSGKGKSNPVEISTYNEDLISVSGKDTYNARHIIKGCGGKWENKMWLVPFKNIVLLENELTKNNIQFITYVKKGVSLSSESVDSDSNENESIGNGNTEIDSKQVSKKNASYEFLDDD